MPKSNVLSRTAQAALKAAVAHPDHLAVPPEHMSAVARRAVVQSLLKAGLLQEVPAEDDGAAWRTTEGGERLALRATEAGLAAIGAGGDPAGTVEAAQTQVEPPNLAVTERPAFDARVTTGELLERPLAHPARPGLRAVAQAVVAAWDDSDANRPNLPTSIEALRAALASKASARTQFRSTTHGQPRPDTKRSAVLALLRRPEGATVAQVTDATGWATHTVRGFFAGLKKAGIPVDVLERVRQVGPGKEGSRASYTVYRVGEVG